MALIRITTVLGLRRPPPLSPMLRKIPKLSHFLGASLTLYPLFILHCIRILNQRNRISLPSLSLSLWRIRAQIMPIPCLYCTLKCIPTQCILHSSALCNVMQCIVAVQSAFKRVLQSALRCNVMHTAM